MTSARKGHTIRTMAGMELGRINSMVSVSAPLTGPVASVMG